MSAPVRDIVLGTLFTLATLAVVVAVMGREEGRMARAATGQEARAIEAGAALYATYCSSCHGASGEGIGALGPALNDAHFFTDRLSEVGWPGTLEDYIINTTAAGRVTATRPLYAGDGAVVMAAWGERYGGPLRDDQVRAVAAFVLNWEATARGDFVFTPLPTPTPDPAELAAAGGDRVFLDAGCGTCHAVAGVSTGDDGPDLARIGAEAGGRVTGQAADEYLRESVLVPNAHVAEGYTAPGACSAVLTAAQLDALVAYLQSLE
jgi:mono/diheme cytochrome c family protein